MATPPETKPAEVKKRTTKRLDESSLYTQEEDKGGWGRHDSFLRQALDAPNTTKCAWNSRSKRFEKSQGGVDKIYDTDTGSGHKRSLRLSVRESPVKYGAVFNDTARWGKDNSQSTSALYNVGGNPNTGSIESKLKNTPRRYAQMRTVVERGFDPREGPGDANIPDYDHGDGPKPNFATIAKDSPRNYCMMTSKEQRGPDVDGAVDPVDEYDTNIGRNITIARNIETTSMEYSNMRSKVPRFEASSEEYTQDYRGQGNKTIGKDLHHTPRRYHNVGTKTPRFNKDGGYSAGGQDFYEVESGAKKSIGKRIGTHPMRYGSSIGSQTARFPTEDTGYGAIEGGDADGMSYNTDTGNKLSFERSVERSARKYSQFRSKVPRFNSDSLAKKKGKKLDMDAVYEAELKRVTGVREPAEYYIPNYGAHRGVSEAVKRSTRRYASSFGSKTPRFPGENKEPGN